MVVLLRVDSKAQRAIAFHQMLEDNDFESMKIELKQYKNTFDWIFQIQVEFNYNKLSLQLQNTIFEIFLKVILKIYDRKLTNLY